MDDRTLTVRVVASIGAFKAQMGVAAGETRAFGKTVATSTGAARQSFDRLGRGAVIAGAAIATGFALAAKAAVSFESAFAGVRKTVDGTDAALSEIRDGIRGMAREMPATALEISSVAQAAGALGVATPDVLAFSRVMIQLGEATDDLPADAAAVGMARLMNIMQTAPADVERVASALVDLGNNGASTEGEILALATRMASAGRQVGLTEADVLAFANALSSVGIEAEAGGSAFSRVMIKIQNAVMDSGDALDTFAGVAGSSAEQFAQSFRGAPAEAIVAFVEGLRRVHDEGGNTNLILEDLGLADIRVGNALRSAAGAGDLFRESLARGADAFSENSALAEEYEQRLDTTGAQLEILRNNVVDLAIGFGDTLLPAIRGTADFSTDMIAGFQAMPGPIKSSVAAGAALAGTVALLGGSFLLLAPKLLAAKTLWGDFAKAAPTAARGLTTSAKAVGVFTGALTVGLLVWQRWTAQREADRQRTEEWIDLLGQERAEVERLTKARVNEIIARDDLIKHATAAGVSTSTLRAALRGEAVAVDEVLERHRDLQEAYSRNTAQSRDAVESAALLARAVDDEGLAAQRAAAHHDRLAEAEREQAYAGRGSADTMERLAGVTREVTAATAEQADITGEAAEALEAYLDTLDRLYARAFGVQEAVDQLTSDFYDFVDGVRAAQVEGDKFATSLDASTASGLQNREVLRGLVQGALDVAAAMAEQGHSEAEIAAVTAANRQELINTYVQLGFNEAAVREYVDVLLQVKGVGSIHTSITADTSQAIAAVNAYIQTLSQLSGAVASAERAEAHRFRNQLGLTNPPPLLGSTLPSLGRVPRGPAESAARRSAASGASDAADKAREARQEADRRMATRFEFGDIGVDEYKAYLAKRLAAEQEFTEDWSTLKREQQRINEEIGKAWIEAAESIREAEDNQHAAGRMSTERYRQILVDRAHAAIEAYGYWSDEAQGLIDKITQIDADAVDRWMTMLDRQHEVGELSSVEYRRLLAARLDDLEKFSDEWMAVWREIDKIDKDAEDRAKKRADDRERRAKEHAAGVAKTQKEAFDRLNRLLDDEQSIRKRIEDLTRQHHERLRGMERQLNDDQRQVLDERKQQLLGWADVSQRVVVGWGNSASALAGNIRDQIAVFDEWTNALADARRRGVSEEVIDLLGLAEGPQALGQLRMFTSATEAEIADLNRAVEERTKQAGDRVAHEQGKSYSQVSRLLLSLAEKHAAEVEALTEEFLADQRALTDELAQLGMDQGRSWADAINQAMQSGLEGLRRTAAEAQAIMAGQASAQGGQTTGPGGATAEQTATGWRVTNPGGGVVNLKGGEDRLARYWGSYDEGGFLPTGWSMAFNGTGRPEPVGHQLAQPSVTMNPTFIVEVYDANGRLVTDDRLRVVVREENRDTAGQRTIVGSR